MTHSDPKPAASDDLFTADDVTAAAEPIWVDWCNHPSGCDCKALAMETARRSVAAVAPSIAARALRQAADDLEAYSGHHGCVRRLRARANQIESPATDVTTETI